MRYTTTSMILFISILVMCCTGSDSVSESESAGKKPILVEGYDFSNPDTTFVLPDTLREISGMTYTDSVSFACVQDENGILFLYDAIHNKIKRQFTFHSDGDYEGLARVGNTMYVLQSDGVLYEIRNYDSSNFAITSYVTGIPANNNEGLCYDPERNRLLIACKSKTRKGVQYKDKRAIYAFDLNSKKLSKNPVLDFDVQVLKQFAVDHNIELPIRSKKNGHIEESSIKFKASAIEIHPFTQKLFLLSAADHMLFIFDMNGKIEHIQVLDPAVFNKAEGITFFANGDMLITNEGQGGHPTLLRFNYSR